MKQSTIRECTEADRKMMDQQEGIDDGLFVFCEQAQSVVDVARYLGKEESDDLYVIDVWNKKKEEKMRGIFNFTEVGSCTLGDISSLASEYDNVKRYVADNRADMLRKFTELCAELNHF